MGYKHITIFERSCIYQFLNLGMSIRYKNSSFKRYFPIVAQKKYEKRRIEYKRNSKFDHNSIKYIEAKIL